MQTDTWVIAATNQNLEQKIERGKFRRDLYYRLNTVKITIEPLHKRPEGIPHLVKYYTKIYASESTGKNLKPLCQNIVDRLTAYHWPGNVRELQNVLRRFMVLGVNEGNLDEFVCSIDASQQHPFKFTQYLSSLGNQFADLSSLQLKKIRKEAKNQIDKILIEYALRKTAGNRKAASKLIEISYRLLLSKMEDIDIQPILLFNNDHAHRTWYVEGSLKGPQLFKIWRI